MAAAASSNSPSPAGGAVFLSYAREDDAAARRIAEALRGFGVEAWFDQSELRGGDAWDQKIRRQIKDCALFIPIVSAHTQARGEGYFRLEWKLAAERTHLMAEGVPFLAPVVIDDTPDSSAAVPAEFLHVQWTRLPGGALTPEFVAQIKRLLAAPRSAAPAMRASPASAAAPAVAAPAKPSGVPGWTWGALTAAVAGIAVAVYVSRRPAPTPAEPSKPAAEAKGTPAQAPDLSAVAAAKADPKSVAVLAFANLSAEKDNEYFSDGLSENILDKLARVPGLRVMARTSSFSYKGKNVPVQQIAAELHVGTVIEGSVQRAGNKLRVVAQLINATDGMHVWSETYDRELTTTDIFAMQDEIASKIASRLTPNPAAPAVERRPTANLAAYDAYLRGQSWDRQALGNYSRVRAVPFYEEAVRLDPGFALAWAHLAHSLAWIYWGGGEIDGDVLARAQRALAEATRLQPDLAEVHLARAALLKSDGANLAEARRELALAEKLKPNDPEIAFEQALVARFSGRLEEALEFCRQATERDPRDPNVYNTKGLVLHFLARYPEALIAFERSAALNLVSIPNSNRANTILRAEGDASKALREYDAIAADQFDVQTRKDKMELLLAAGRNSDALAEIARIGQPAVLAQWGYYVRALMTARVREMMGDADGARRDYLEAWPIAVAYRNQHRQSWRSQVAVALAAAGLGQKEEALAAAREALKLVPPDENPYYAQLVLLPVLAEVQARFGQTNDALAIVRDQIEKGWWRRNDLWLDSNFWVLRKDPRFRALAEKAPL